MNEEKITENIKKCLRFDYCSANSCILDIEANLKETLPGEERCPFTIKKKNKHQKGIKTLAPYNILEFIVKSNMKMLNKRNQKRWRKLKIKNN